MTQKFKISKAT